MDKTTAAMTPGTGKETRGKKGGRRKEHHRRRGTERRVPPRVCWEGEEEVQGL